MGSCMREVLRAVFKKKPIIALMEPDVKKGALTSEQVRVPLITWTWTRVRTLSECVPPAVTPAACLVVGARAPARGGRQIRGLGPWCGDGTMGLPEAEPEGDLRRHLRR